MTESTKTKHFVRAQNAGHLRQLLGDLKWDASTLAHRLGVSQSGVSKWLKDDSAPFWTILACEGLRGAEKLESKSRQVWLVKVESTKAELLGTFLRGAGVAWTKVE